MAVFFPYEQMIEELRGIIQETWTIPVNHPIIEVGEGTSQTITQDNLPMAILELDGEASIMDVTAGDSSSGHSAKAVTTRFPYYIWLLLQTSADEDDIGRLRTQLKKLQFAVLGNRTLNGTVSLAKLNGVNWTGKGRPWPVEDEEGIGVIAGYVGIELIMVEI